MMKQLTKLIYPILGMCMCFTFSCDEEVTDEELTAGAIKIYADRSTIAENQSVNFTDSSTDVSSRKWVFNGGDPATSVSEAVEVSYSTLGEYYAVLEVTYLNGDSEVDSVKITVQDDGISDPDPLVAAFTANETTIDEGETITFTDASVGGATSWYWTFSGATVETSTDQNPAVTYPTGGVYDVSLLVIRDSDGKENLLIKTGYITVIEPEIVLGNDILTAAGIDSGFGTNDGWTFITGDVNASNSSTEIDNLAYLTTSDAPTATVMQVKRTSAEAAGFKVGVSSNAITVPKGDYVVKARFRAAGGGYNPTLGGTFDFRVYLQDHSTFTSGGNADASTAAKQIIGAYKGQTDNGAVTNTFWPDAIVEHDQKAGTNWIQTGDWINVTVKLTATEELTNQAIKIHVRVGNTQGDVEIELDYITMQPVVTK